jgi:Ca-activated chloride channel family protein
MRWISALLLLAGCAEWHTSIGNRYYRAGDHARAAEAYEAGLARAASSSTLQYNLGTALLRLARYEDARRHLEAATRASDLELRQRAYYNAGNADLEPVVRADVTDGRVEHLERAILSYKRALLLSSSDADAKWNLELAQRLLEQEQQSSGGADDSPQQGGGGGGGEGPESQAPSEPNPRPSPASGSGERPQMTMQQAERMLGRLEQAERELQHAKLRRDQTRAARVRDW